MNFSVTHIDRTKSWISKMVIGLNLCPFAQYPFDQGIIDYATSDADDFEQMMKALVSLLTKVHSTSSEELSNAFLIYTADVSFEFLLDIEYSLLGILEESGLDTEYQTVVFHPQFRYEGEDIKSHANFTNRSPYPMIHILRAAEVSEAIAKTINVNLIPERNAEKLEKLGIKKVSEIFEEGFADRVLSVLQ